MRRFGLLFLLPAMVVLAGVLLPLISGATTLYLRDVLVAHFPLKVSQAEAWRAGEPLPLVDPYRGGGQPLLGNPNSLPLYPSNLLYLVASPLWAMNAHFWLHLLLAPAAFFWLARAWGLSRPGSWAAGVTYAVSGYFLSLLNFYNLVAGAVLAPAFAAACLDSWRGGRHRLWPVLGLLWAMLVLAGDPVYAGLALVLGLSAAVWRYRCRPRQPWRLAAALLCGTVVTAPMVVEFLRILPLSYRGHWQYPPGAVLAQSWNPVSVLEWLLPLPFRGPDWDFWGQPIYSGNPPLFYSLYPGFFCLLFLGIGGRPRRRAAAWAWMAVGGGLFLALGAYNPLILLYVLRSGGSVVRYPVKFWLLVAMGGALLVGLGFDRWLRRQDRRVRRRLWIAGSVGVVATAALWWPAAGRGLVGFVGPWLVPAQLEQERVRWALLALLSLGVIASLAAGLRVARRRRAVAGALLLMLHLLTQLYFLAPLYDSDDATFYSTPPPLLGALRDDPLLVHCSTDLFGRKRVAELPWFRFGRLWLARMQFAELYPFAGSQWGLRYELNTSPEGLDSFFLISAIDAVKGLEDRGRVRILAASGVDILLVDRALDIEESDPVRLRERRSSFGHDLYIYEIEGAAPVQLVHTVLRVPNLTAALEKLVDPAFDPRTMTVLADSSGPALAGSGAEGRVEILKDSVEELEVEVETSAPGMLVVQRAALPIYRSSLDGEPAPHELGANLHRIAVAVPPGHHTVRLWLDRRPTRLASAAAVLGFVGIAMLAWRRRSP